MKKIILLLILLFLFPILALAQTNNSPQNDFFTAKVIKIINEKDNILPDGTQAKQQDLLLRVCSGSLKDKEINFYGIGDFSVANNNIYKVGDNVLVVASFDDEGNSAYFITDYVRTKSLWWLFAIFSLSLIIVGRMKGLRSLLALILTFLVIIKYIVPKILSGASPFFITLVGSFFILFIIIYITEGWRARSHIAVFSILISLIITILLSQFFVSFAKLTGIASEDTSFLLYLGDTIINFKGLLLAGIIIGALGVLDDVVISQIATVEQISKANRNLDKKNIYKYAYKVGVSHIASMTNTLFLAYAGVSLPLLVLFVSGNSAFSGWNQIVNNEAIATEIVRTVAGSIGLVLSVPITTVIAVWWYGRGR